jgi:thymidylate synthase (FAD)
MKRSRNIEITIHPLAKTVVDREAVRRWLDEMGADEFEVPGPEAATDAALLVALAAKQCYMSFQPGLNPNVSKIRADMAEYLDNVMKSGHGSVLEHAVFTFAINGVSRIFTGEMNRHRAGWAISERSMRFIRFEDSIPWWLPLSLREVPGDDAELALKKQQSRAVFHDIFAKQAEAYSQLVQIWDMDASDKNFAYKKAVTSCLRRIIGMGVATGGVWSGNIRALRHVLTMRCAPSAEEEICHVFSRIAAEIAKSEPMLFGDFHQDENGYWTPRYVKV